MATATLVRHRYAALAALTLALTACGGGGGGGGEVPSVQEDKARAERIVLTEGDLPDLSRQADDGSADDSDDPFRKCLNDNKVLVDLGQGPRSAESTFTNEDETRVRSSAVTLAESKGDAKAAFAEVSGSGFVGCFENAIRTGFADSVGEEAGIEKLSVAKLPVDEYGDDTIAYRATLDLTSLGQSVPLAFDYIFFRVDRAVAVVFSFDVNGSFDTGDRNRLSAAVADRMDAEV